MSRISPRWAPVGGMLAAAFYLFHSPAFAAADLFTAEPASAAQHLLKAPRDNLNALKASAGVEAVRVVKAHAAAISDDADELRLALSDI
jgi:hypothetical protein